MFLPQCLWAVYVSLLSTVAYNKAIALFQPKDSVIMSSIVCFVLYMVTVTHV